MFDAFYMTLITVTTVGYAEIHPLSHAGRVFNSFLIMFGVTTMLLAVGAMTQTIIELELNQFFGKRRVRSMIDKLEGHVILCGFGRVGRGAADELRKAGIPFVVIDNNDERVERAIKAGMLAVLADASRDETLRDVGIDRAKGLDRHARLRRRQSVPDSDRQDAQSEFAAFGARGRRELGAEDAARRRRFRVRAYNSTGHRMAQAIAEAARAAVSRFHRRNIGLDVGIEQVQVADAAPSPEDRWRRWRSGTRAPE